MKRIWARLRCVLQPSVSGDRYIFSSLQLDALYTLPINYGAACDFQAVERLFVSCCSRRVSSSERLEEGTCRHEAPVACEGNTLIFQQRELLHWMAENIASLWATKGLPSRRACRRLLVVPAGLQCTGFEAPARMSSDNAVLAPLHGIMISHLHRRLASKALGSTPSALGILAFVACQFLKSFSPRDESGVNSCFSLPQPMELCNCNQYERACRLAAGPVCSSVSARAGGVILLPYLDGPFSLHQYIVRLAVSCLCALSLWSSENVGLPLRRIMKQVVRTNEVGGAAWIEVTKKRVEQLASEGCDNFPQPLRNMTKDDVMAFATYATRFWVSGVVWYGRTGVWVATPPWRLQLSGEPHRPAVLELLERAMRSVEGWPRDVPFSEHPAEVSWSVTTALTSKKNLARLSMLFPFHFRVKCVVDGPAARKRFDKTLGDTTVEEVVEGLLSRPEDGQRASAGGGPPPVAACHREIELVVRVVVFLRQRHLCDIPVTYGEMRAALVRADNVERCVDSDLLFRALVRYDAVAVSRVSDEREPQLTLLDGDRVHLSVREVRALHALEAFRAASTSPYHLYSEAIGPFLNCCRDAGGEYHDRIISFGLLKMWLQLERLPMQDTELVGILASVGGPYRFDESRNIVWKNSKPQVTVLPPAPLPPPPSMASGPSIFDSQLSRVLKAQSMDGLLNFVQTALHAVFDVLLPHVSVPSGMSFRKLVRRIRWSTLAITLGPLISFVEAFDGLFFDISSNALLSGSEPQGDVDFVVSAYNGRVSAWLLYARLIVRLFPTDIEMPLGLIAEALSWGVRFAPKFGDLPSLLRLVGRQCRDGKLLAETGMVHPAYDKDDTQLWELLVTARRAAPLHHRKCNSDGLCEYILLSEDELYTYLLDAGGTRDRTLAVGGSDGERELSTLAVRRLPFFFKRHLDKSGTGTYFVSVAVPCSPLPAGAVEFVEQYVCPLLRQHKQTTVAELDEHLGWSCGSLDTHPTGMRAAAGRPPSTTSLCGLLRRYTESVQLPKIVMQESSTTPSPLHPQVVVMPNSAVYTSPEDMLLLVNGLHVSEGGAVRVQPTHKPISLFEVISQQVDLQHPFVNERDATDDQPKWNVMLVCERDSPEGWTKEFNDGTGDILVWSEGQHARF